MRLCLFFASFLVISSTDLMAREDEPCNGEKLTCEQRGDACCYDRWTGFTVGFNVGAMINASEGRVRPSGAFAAANNPLRTDSFDFGDPAFITGAQIGYNYQAKALVAGIEADFNYSTLNETDSTLRNLAAPLDGTFFHSTTDKWTWYGTVRPRLGFAINPVLIYGTGGLAGGYVTSRTHVTFSSAGDRYRGSEGKWRLGWTAGAGLEWGFTRHWSTKLEYLYVHLKEYNYPCANVSPPSFPTFSYTTDLETQGHFIRLGFNYTI